MLQIDYQDIILNEDIEYYHNPFGGIDDEEVPLVLQPKYQIEDWVTILENEHPVIIQFVGKKGRGKTTHLRALFQHMKYAEIHFLDQLRKRLEQPTSHIVFIDSIGRVSLIKRLGLWSKKNTSYVITTHWNRKPEFWFSKRSSKTYYFKGLHTKNLETTIRNRIALASDKTADQIRIDSIILAKLIHRFGDNFRGILNFMYDLYNIKSNGTT